MENQEFQNHILKRIQKLEAKTFDGTFEQNYKPTPREQAKSISEGDTKEHHIGRKSPEVLQQELNSHVQSYRETFTDDEEKEWIRKKQSLIDQLRKAT